MGHLHATNEDLINDTRVIFEDDQIIIGGHDLWTKGYMKGTFPLLTKFITNICKQGGKRSYLPISDDVDDDDNVYLALAGGHQKKKTDPANKFVLDRLQQDLICWHCNLYKLVLCPILFGLCPLCWLHHHFYVLFVA